MKANIPSEETRLEMFKESLEGVITAIHGDVLEIEFKDGLPHFNDALIVK